MSRPTKERLEEIREWPSGVYGAHKDALFEEIDALAAENVQLKQLQTAEKKAVDALTAKLDAARSPMSNNERYLLYKERDQNRAELESIKKDRDSWHSDNICNAVSSENDELKKELEAMTVQKDSKDRLWRKAVCERADRERELEAVKKELEECKTESDSRLIFRTTYGEVCIDRDQWKERQGKFKDALQYIKNTDFECAYGHALVAGKALEQDAAFDVHTKSHTDEDKK